MASHELAAAQDQMILLGRKSARERVVSFLIMLSNAAVRHGKPDNPVGVPMTRNDMGDYLGLSLETVSRALTQLKTQGLIQLLDERRVRLVKPEAMPRSRCSSFGISSSSASSFWRGKRHSLVCVSASAL